MTAVLVMIGAAVGAPLRYVADRAVQARHDSVFPWGTFTVNVAASFILGVVAGHVGSSALTALIGTGFCGALSTWSTLGYETVRLTEERAWSSSAFNIAASVLAGLGAAGLGFSL